MVRGWMQYYGAFYRSVLHPLLQRINVYLMRWIRKKYRRLRGFKKAKTCWEGNHHPLPPAVRALALDLWFLGTRGDKSRVTGDRHARIRGSREVKSLPATRPVVTMRASFEAVWGRPPFPLVASSRLRRSCVRSGAPPACRRSSPFAAPGGAARSARLPPLDRFLRQLLARGEAGRGC
ncbi:group II intron maturase-specific domain-containing protein [Nonomuraea angiospora]|uniref:group II intron maturase-specific domain-containing protein n=1 Tax=Nonomuraea angiospora TaxID=46172 RepID=UPI001CEF0D34